MGFLVGTKMNGLMAIILHYLVEFGCFGNQLRQTGM